MKNALSEIVRLMLGLTMCLGVALGQSGGPYQITQSVVAGGGGSSNAGAYVIEGTVGQPSAGTYSASGALGVEGGFWQGFLAPTAAGVSVSGTVRTLEGLPINNVVLQLADSSGTIAIARSNPFGYFRFDNVEAGNNYVLNATHKQFEFATRVVNVVDEVVDLTVTPMAFK